MSLPFWTLDHTFALQVIDRVPVAERRRLSLLICVTAVWRKYSIAYLIY